MSYIVDLTFDEVPHKFSNIEFYPVFDRAPVLVDDMQTTDGGNTANVRWQNETGAGVEVQIDEEQFQNPEVNHVTEVVGYMAFSSFDSYNNTIIDEYISDTSSDYSVITDGSRQSLFGNIYGYFKQMA